MRVPWTGRRSNQSILEEISPEYSLEVVTFCEQCPIHDLRRRFNFRTKDQAWSLKFFCFSSVQSLSRVRLFMTPWTAARKASLSIIKSGVQSISHPSSWWYHPAIPSSVPSPFPPVFNLPQHQGLIKWVSSLHQVAKLLEFQLQHQSFQWTFRTDFL